MIYVFSGPSISPSEVSARWPGTVALPPIAHHDLARQALGHGDVAVILDGFFWQRIAVRHKEILEALESGVVVLGAASMGALRAVELQRYGMLGSGCVFRLFQSGFIDGDDEVGLRHEGAEKGFQATSEAMVNIRVTLRHLRRMALIDERSERELVTVAKAMPFTERTYGHIVEAAAPQLPGFDPQSMLKALKLHRRDVKRRDAIRAIGAALDLPATGASDARIFETVFLDRFRGEREHYLPDQPENDIVGQTDAVDYVRLLAGGFPEYLYRHRLIMYLGAGVAPGSGPVATLQAQFSTQRGCAIEDWLTTNKVSASELERWLLTTDRAFAVAGGDTTESLVAAAAEMASRDAVLPRRLTKEFLAAWLSEEEIETLSEMEARCRVITRSRHYPDALAVLALSLKADGFYEPGYRGAIEVLRFNRSLAARRPDHTPTRLRAQEIVLWLTERWGADATRFPVMADRGFITLRHLLWHARPFYLAARFTAGHREVRPAGG